MPAINVSWAANPTQEQISGYNIYLDSTLAQSSTASPARIPVDVAGVHTVEIAAVGSWGEGPKSNPVTTPPFPSKVTITGYTLEFP